MAAFSVTVGCGGGGGGLAASPGGSLQAFPSAALAISDVQTILAQAVTRAAHDGVAVDVAVSDREGNVLGVFDMTGVGATSPDGDIVNGGVDSSPTSGIAIEKARTAAFLSSNQDAFSTRTGGFITASHFPPGVMNQPQGPLFGLPFSQLPCGDVQKHGNGISGNPGGIPIYLNGVFAGGIGVDGASDLNEDEVVALAGDLGYAPSPGITADNIFLNGIQLVWIGVGPPASLPVVAFGSLPGGLDPMYPTITPTPSPPSEIVFDGIAGEWRFPPIDSPLTTSPKLTQADVQTMVAQSLNREIDTRAAIRSPIGVPARMQIGVTDTAGNILGVFRTNDATMFSLDIVIQKGRSVVSFSDPSTSLGQQLRVSLGLPPSEPIAFTTRTLGFLAQPFYPPGIDGTAPGPLFQIQQQLYQQPPSPNCSPQGDGITLFPGSTPLYKGGVLVGGLGISGDGVDQDDFVAAAGTVGFTPGPVPTADHFSFRGTPLPYLKFPRQPTLF